MEIHFNITIDFVVLVFGFSACAKFVPCLDQKR